MTPSAYTRVLGHMRAVPGWQSGQEVAKSSCMTNREASQYLKILTADGILQSDTDPRTNSKRWRLVEVDT